MPVQWFFAPYQRTASPRPTRECAMNNFNAQIIADGADPARPWSECECLGDYAAVKVRASQATLDLIASTPGFRRVPLSRLDDPLSTLTLTQRQNLRSFVQSLGYSLLEIQARFPDATLSSYTVGDVLRFVLSRKLEPRYDRATDTIVLDGPAVDCRPVEQADADIA